MTDQVQEAVRAFIVENFLFGDTSTPLNDTDSLIENGVIDSTGVLELIGFIEERFGIVVADAEILPDNLDSLQRISAFVSSRLSSRAAA